MKRNFISNSPESTRMFKNDLLESLSKVSFFVPLIIYIPIILFLAWKALVDVSLPTSSFLSLFILGLFIWTLTEYVLHRFVFHVEPSPAWGKRIHFIFHGVRHDYPNDAKRLVMPPSASLPLAITFYLLFDWILPANAIFAFFPGFVAGYLAYDIDPLCFASRELHKPILEKIETASPVASLFRFNQRIRSKLIIMGQNIQIRF